VFLHIPQQPRERMFSKLFRSLKQNGTFCIEDYYLKNSSAPFTSEEVDCLTSVVGAVFVPDQESYMRHLERAGFHGAAKTQPY